MEQKTQGMITLKLSKVLYKDKKGNGAINPYTKAPACEIDDAEALKILISLVDSTKVDYATTYKSLMKIYGKVNEAWYKDKETVELSTSQAIVLRDYLRELDSKKKKSQAGGDISIAVAEGRTRVSIEEQLNDQLDVKE